MCCLFGSQKLKSKKHYLLGKNIFEVIFPMFFWDENFKTCLAFYFPALETFFKIGQNNLEIANLEFEITVSSKIMFSYQRNNLGENIC